MMTQIAKSTFTTGTGTPGQFYSLPALAENGYPRLNRLPVSIRIVLESLLRNCDGLKVTEKDVDNLASWNAKNPGSYEIPFTVARIVLQDLTGVPLLVDLAAMRSAVAGLGKDASVIEPLVPVDLVVDHSVQVDWAGRTDALEKNLDIEFQRNAERYEFRGSPLRGHRPPGEPGISDAGRHGKGRRLFPGHSRGYGLPYHDDQRYRRGRLGRGRY